MKKIIAFCFSILFLASCSTSSDVASSKLLQKRKYQKGWHSNRTPIFDKNNQKKGAIINIASIYGMISPDYRIYSDSDRKNSEVYGATKAGIIQMNKYFSVHLADRNIRCNSVSPGGIYNPENPQSDEFISNYSFRCPMKRMANTDEIVGAIAYFASDLASYTTGQNLAIDGGMSSW